MRPAKSKYRLWQIMLAIAVLAGLFAVFGVFGAVVILAVFSVVLLPVWLERLTVESSTLQGRCPEPPPTPDGVAPPS